MQGIRGKRCNFQKLTTKRQAFSIIACRRVFQENVGTEHYYLEKAWSQGLLSDGREGFPFFI